MTLDLREIGSTGLNLYGGWIYEEYLPELSGERGRRVFREMAEQDPVVGGILFAIEMLMRQVEWQVVPSEEGSEEAQDVATFVEECIRDLDPAWPETLSEILSMLQFGWSWMEVVYKRREGNRSSDLRRKSRYNDGKIGWRKWSIRSQDTLNRWEFENGEVTGLTQLGPPKWEVVTIPKWKSLHFRTKSRKENPEGVSVLRNAYRPWYFKKHIETIEGIGVERDLAGLPVIWAPARLLTTTASSDEIAMRDTLKKIVTNIRRDEQEGIIMPLQYDESGKELYRLELLTSGGQRQFDTDKIVARYDQRIAMTVLADFILLGHEAVGSYALSSDKTALFAVALGAWLDIVGQAIEKQELPRLLALNGIDLKYLPSLQHSDIETPNLGQLGDFISKLASAGAILFPNPALERSLLEAAGLPISEGGLEEDVTAPPPAPAPAGGAPGAAPQQSAQTTQQAEEPFPFDEALAFWAGNVEAGKKGFQTTGDGDLAGRLGRCYELSGRYVAFENPSATLVHGSIQGGSQKPRIDHAWGELKNGDVWEPATNAVWPRAAFRSVFHPTESRRYSHDELLARILATEHWGPWAEGFNERYEFWAGNVVKGRKGFQTKGSYDTEAQFSKDGKWDSAREATVHEPILAGIRAQNAPVDPLGSVVYMTGGGFGSGKSTLLNTFPEIVGFPPRSQVRVVDPDAIKPQIPEFGERVARGDKTAASFVHEESSYLAKRGVFQSIKDGCDTIYDTSGDSHISRLSDKVAQFRAAGARRVVAHYATPGSREEAIRRVNARAAAAGAARRDIPAPAVIANHQAVARTWADAARQGVFDELTLWSTAGAFGSPPTQIAHASGGHITVLDQAAYDAFVG